MSRVRCSRLNPSRSTSSGRYSTSTESSVSPRRVSRLSAVKANPPVGQQRVRPNRRTTLRRIGHLLVGGLHDSRPSILKTRARLLLVSEGSACYSRSLPDISYRLV